MAESLLNSDPRMIDVLGALMGIDMQGFSRPEGTEDLPEGLSARPTSPPKPSPASPPPQPSASTSSPPPKPAAEPADVEMKDAEDTDDEEAKAKKEAEAEKKLGAEAYKKKDLETAGKHFSKAWDLWPKDISFLTNLSAVYFEQGDYDKAIEEAEKAVDQGREVSF